MTATKTPPLVEPEPAQAVDQRTGKPIVVGSIPTAAELQQERAAQAENEARQLAELGTVLEELYAPGETHGDGSVDVARLNRLVQSQILRITALPGGVADEIARLRRMIQARATSTEAKAREKQAAAEREAATAHAIELVAELQARSAWIFANILAGKANEFRLQELIDELTALEGQHHLGRAVGEFVRLPGDCAAVAGQRLQIVGRRAADGFLPALEQCPELPDEFQRPAAPKADVDQSARAAFDPSLPKDHAIRMEGGSTPARRNEDGTIAGAHVSEPFAAQRFAPVPRTDAEELAARRRVADDLAPKDGA